MYRFYFNFVFLLYVLKNHNNIPKLSRTYYNRKHAGGSIVYLYSLVFFLIIKRHGMSSYRSWHVVVRVRQR